MTTGGAVTVNVIAVRGDIRGGLSVELGPIGYGAGGYEARIER